jgi:hypothetical protein
LGVVLCLGCFLGFLLGSWAWEQAFSMLLGSTWAMLGIPSSQVGLIFALFDIACQSCCWIFQVFSCFIVSAVGDHFLGIGAIIVPIVIGSA